MSKKKLMSVFLSLALAASSMGFIAPAQVKAASNVHYFATAEEFVSEFENAQDGDTFKYNGNAEDTLGEIDIDEETNPAVKTIVLDPTNEDKENAEFGDFSLVGRNITVNNLDSTLYFANLSADDITVSAPIIEDDLAGSFSVEEYVEGENIDLSNVWVSIGSGVDGNVSLHNCKVVSYPLNVYGTLTMDEKCLSIGQEISVTDPTTEEKTIVVPAAEDPDDPETPVVDPAEDEEPAPTSEDKDEKVGVNISISGPKKLAPFKTAQMKSSVGFSGPASKVEKMSKVIKWTSSNKKFATVSSKGLVTAKKAGAGKTVTITASIQGVKATHKITIKGLVKKITVKGKSSLKVGKKMKLKTSIKSVGKNVNKKVTWKVSNKKFASISSTGVLKAKKAGKNHTITVTATAKDGSKVKGTKKIRIK